MVALIPLDAAPIKLTRVCGLKAVPRTTHDRAVTVVTAAFPTVGLEAGAGEREEREEKNKGRVTGGRGEGRVREGALLLSPATLGLEPLHGYPSHGALAASCSPCTPTREAARTHWGSTGRKLISFCAQGLAWFSWCTVALAGRRPQSRSGLPRRVKISLQSSRVKSSRVESRRVPSRPVQSSSVQPRTHTQTWCCTFDLRNAWTYRGYPEAEEGASHACTHIYTHTCRGYPETREADEGDAAKDKGRIIRYHQILQVVRMKPAIVRLQFCYQPGEGIHQDGMIMVHRGQCPIDDGRRDRQTQHSIPQASNVEVPQGGCLADDPHSEGAQRGVGFSPWGANQDW